MSPRRDGIPPAAGRIRFVNRYTRDEIRANPACLYVFGDNMERRGFGGQAAEARGEPNAVGVPTKWRPAMTPDAFFTDADFDDATEEIKLAFDKMVDWLWEGGDVVWPADGVGTGRARLGQTAPTIAAFIDGARYSLIHKFGVTP